MTIIISSLKLFKVKADTCYAALWYFVFLCHICSVLPKNNSAPSWNTLQFRVIFSRAVIIIQISDFWLKFEMPVVNRHQSTVF